MPRFILLEHTGAPDDPPGRHHDLLLESGTACRTWRLQDIPQPGGPAVSAVELPPHRLAWLDHEAGEVSGGRGFARRVDVGTFDVCDGDDQSWESSSTLLLRVAGRMLAGWLRLNAGDQGWSITCETGDSLLFDKK